MDYKSQVMQAINYIEKNLKHEIALTDCARISGYSDYNTFLYIYKHMHYFLYIYKFMNDSDV